MQLQVLMAVSLGQLQLLVGELLGEADLLPVLLVNADGVQCGGHAEFRVLTGVPHIAQSGVTGHAVAHAGGVNVLDLDHVVGVVDLAQRHQHFHAFANGFAAGTVQHILFFLC